MRVLLLVCLLLLPVGAGTERTAMITDLVGTARLAGQPVKTLQVLSNGAEVEVSAKARISLIFFGDSHMETLTGPCRFQIAPKETRLLAGEPGQRLTLPPTAMRLPSRGERAETMGGTVQRSEKSRLTMPRTLTAPPVFTWEGFPEPMTVWLTRPGQATEVLWKSEPSSGGVVYTGPPLLEDVVYVWELRPVEPDFSEAPWKRFVLLSQASQELIRAAEAELGRAPEDDVVARVLMMQVYADHLMLEEALGAARSALALRPDDAGLKAGLNRLLRELGHPEER